MKHESFLYSLTAADCFCFVIGVSDGREPSNIPKDGLHERVFHFSIWLAIESIIIV